MKDKTIYSTHLCFAECLSPSTSYVQVARQIQDCDLSSYRRVFLNILPSGRERIQRFNTHSERGELVWAIVFVQRWELLIVPVRIRGCTWGGGDDFRRAGDGVLGYDA